MALTWRDATGESNLVVQAIAAHHEDVEMTSVLDVLVQAADTLSGARPGARQEMLESYVKRLEKLETIAMSFRGVSKSFAIQAGREIRIMVEGKIVSDEESNVLCRDIAKKIEKELTYPGQIRVIVIREDPCRQLRQINNQYEIPCTPEMLQL